MDNKLALYLWWIIDAIQTTKTYRNRFGDDAIITDDMVYDACLMQLIHIGESMNKICKKYHDFTLASIDLKKIINFRNFVAHDYLSINRTIMYTIVINNLPILEKEIVIYIHTHS